MKSLFVILMSNKPKIKSVKTFIITIFSTFINYGKYLNNVCNIEFVYFNDDTTIFTVFMRKKINVLI